MFNILVQTADSEEAIVVLFLWTEKGELLRYSTDFKFNKTFNLNKKCPSYKQMKVVTSGPIDSDQF